MTGFHWERYFRYKGQEGIFEEVIFLFKNDKMGKRNLIQEKSIPIREKSKCKDPKEEMFEDCQGQPNG